MALADDLRIYDSLMERLTSSYRSRIFAMCKQVEMTPPQFWALKTICKLGSTKMSPLADGLGLSLGAASTLVDRLVTRGLVVRTTDANDRRAVHVSASEKGRQVHDTVIDTMRTVQRTVFEHVSPDLRSTFLAGLADVTAAWEQLAGPADPAGPVCAPLEED